MKSSHTGFTLIEVLIAVAILGILSAIAMPFYGDYVERGHLSQAHTDLININSQIRTEIVKNPNLLANDADGKLQDIVDAYPFSDDISNRYTFTATTVAQDSNSRRYHLLVVPRADSGYTQAMWMDSLGNAYRCTNSTAAQTFQSSGNCEAL